MQKDPYLILGLNEGASREEVTEAYNRLREEWADKRFLEGEEGAEATRKLTEFERAYKDCLEDIENKAAGTTDTGKLYASIESSIKAGNYDEAQRILDDIDIRDAEWHYYQAMIYFKKGWHSESKSQLEICIVLEPHNEKYNTALNKMNDYIKNQSPFAKQNTANNTNNAGANNNASQQQSQQTNQQRAGYSDRPTGAESNANACCDSCCTLMCCDSCCECMGGDLIPCC